MKPHYKLAGERVCGYCYGDMTLRRVCSGQWQWICENDNNFKEIYKRRYTKNRKKGQHRVKQKK